MNPKPPETAQRFLRWFCSSKFLEEVEWDLEELYERNCRQYGVASARRRYWIDVVKHLRPLFIKNLSSTLFTQNRTIMWSNYLKIAVRNFLRHRGFSVINLSGLVLGITSCLIILQYAYHEMSYDDFHDKKESIFRLQQNGYYNGRTITSAGTCAAIGPVVKENLPEVLDYVKLKRSHTALTYQNTVYKEQRVYYTSESFFKVFSYELLQGVDSLVLKEPYSVVISESTAKKYFGDENPIGKTVNSNGWLDFIVTGVFEDPPENTHLKADILYSFETLIRLNGEAEVSGWEWWSYWTYIELKTGTDMDMFEQKLADLIVEKRGEELQKYNSSEVFNLQPIEEIHLYSHFPQELETNGSASIVYGLLSVAAFILVMAWLNFISLSTARAIRRAKETGIRKVLGSSKAQLMTQFLLESLLLNILAAGISLFLAILLLPYFESLAGKPLNSDLFSNHQFWIVFSIVLFAGASLSALYPAFIVSGYKPIVTLRGGFKTGHKSELARKSIVIFQFAISSVLVMATLTVHNQINFMQDKDLGVTIDQTIVVNSPDITDSIYTSRYRAFKTELLRQPTIKGVTTSSDVPGNSSLMNSAGGVRREGAPRTDGFLFKIIDIDYDFVPQYEIEVVSGRNFSKDRNTTSPPILINAKGVQQMGFKNAEEAVGQKISFWGETHEVVGVLKNYHQDSPKIEFQSTIYRPLWDDWGRQYSIKVDTKNLKRTLSAINELYDQFFPGNPYNYSFLNEKYVQQYHAEVLFNKLFNLFSALAIFIACLGLFGLSMYTVFQRMKEIGIRKVLGASVREIVLLLCNQFSKLVVVALLIGLPVSWFIVNDWLRGFAFRMDMSWWMLMIPVLTLFGVAAMSIFLQVFKAARYNPVEILKDE